MKQFGMFTTNNKLKAFLPEYASAIISDPKSSIFLDNCIQ